MPRIAVLGDRDPDNETHVATDAGLEHAGAPATGIEWVPTLECVGRAAERLAGTDGVLVAPGSPYRSMQGALDAITWARETQVPLLGTCGGFQHIVIEFARARAGFTDAGHAEDDPDGACLVVDLLACSLVGQTMAVRIEPGTTAHAAYGSTTVTERYYCRFGLNPKYTDDLVAAGLTIAGADADGEPRIVELPPTAHPFFVGTLFVPQAASRPGAPHPLVAAFVTAASGR